MLLLWVDLQFRYLHWQGFGEHIGTYTSERSFTELKNGEEEEEEMKVEFLHNLKIVMVHYFFGYKSEIEFVKRLLQKAVALETLSLTSRWHQHDPESSDDEVVARTKSEKRYLACLELPPTPKSCFI